MSANSQEELVRIYANRFAETSAYRGRVWQVLVPAYFQQFVGESGTVDACKKHEVVMLVDTEEFAQPESVCVALYSSLRAIPEGLSMP